MSLRRKPESGPFFSVFPGTLPLPGELAYFFTGWESGRPAARRMFPRRYSTEEFLMICKRAVVVFILMAVQSAASFAGELVISPEYLNGKWSLTGKAGCGSSNADYVLFRQNGTLEVMQGGRINRIGFWKTVNDTIVANTLTAPIETEETYPFFGDSYRYDYVSSKVVNAEQDTFTVSMGSDLEKEKRKATLTRCP
jgi:hypothetical protein